MLVAGAFKPGAYTQVENADFQAEGLTQASPGQASLRAPPWVRFPLLD
jgi:hypothetical protein